MVSLCLTVASAAALPQQRSSVLFLRRRSEDPPAPLLRPRTTLVALRGGASVSNEEWQDFRANVAAREKLAHEDKLVQWAEWPFVRVKAADLPEKPAPVITLHERVSIFYYMVLLYATICMVQVSLKSAVGDVTFEQLSAIWMCINSLCLAAMLALSVKSIPLLLIHLVRHPRDFDVLKPALLAHGVIVAIFLLYAVFAADHMNRHIKRYLPEVTHALWVVGIFLGYHVLRSTFLVLRSLILNPLDFLAATWRKCKEIVADKNNQFTACLLLGMFILLHVSSALGSALGLKK